MTPGDRAIRTHVIPLDSTEDIAEGTSWFRFMAPEGVECRPGQFFMLSTVEPSAVAYLARPFSIGDVADGRWAFLLRAMGRGTAWMRSLEPGRMMRVVGPLGRPFARRDRGTHRIIAGGVGIAPFVYLARTIRREQPGARIELYYGERHDRAHVSFDPEMESLFDTLERFTDDGSVGRPGTVLDDLADRLGDEDIAWYACGPTPMMEVAASLLESQGVVGAQFSLEERMACGFGVCQACVVPNRNGSERFSLLCIDGPVVDPTKVEW